MRVYFNKNHITKKDIAMKKKLLKTVLALGFALFLSCGFSACEEEHTHSFTNYISDNNATYETDGTKTAVCDYENCGETDTVTDTGTMLESTLSFNTLTVDGTEAYGKVSNATESFSFLNEITTVGKAKFIVSLDIYGAQQVATKTVPLESGDNTFYLMQTIDEEVTEVYTVTIRRRPMYNVSFDGLLEPQTVEEDCFATEATTIPKKDGYTFISWNYDFTQPITANTTINANWEINPQYIIVENNTILGLTGTGKQVLTELTIPNYITSIGNNAFYDCSSLTSITIPNSVTSIGDRAFYNCSRLTSIIIPNSVTTIGDYAFLLVQ